MGQIQVKTPIYYLDPYGFILLGGLLNQFGSQGTDFSFDIEFNNPQTFWIVSLPNAHSLESMTLGSLGKELGNYYMILS